MAFKTSNQTWVRRAVAIAVGVVLVQIGVVYLLGHRSAPPLRDATLAVAVSPGAQPSTSAVPDSPAPSTAGETPSPSPSPTPSPTPTPSPSPSASAGGLNVPGIDEPGIYLRFSARADGTLDVTERAVFRAITDSVVLTPPTSEGASEIFTRTRASLRGLQVDVGGRPIGDLPERITTAYTVALPTKTTTLTMRYELDGTSVMSKPSTQGRALAYIRPATAGIDRSLPVQMQAAGKGTINLACPRLPIADRACARGSAPSLTVASGLTAATSTVEIQLQLS